MTFSSHSKYNLPLVIFIFIVVVLEFFLGFGFPHQSKAAGTTYYVDNCDVTGNDSNNGTDPSTPWLTINKVNTSSFVAGDTISFRKGCTWREQLIVPSSGSAGSPITFGAYGATGEKPIFMASVAKNTTGDWTTNNTTVTYNISQTSDDKETLPDWGVIGDEESLGKRSDGPALRNGFRFQNVAIAKDSTISSAYIKFYGSNQAPAWGDPESVSPVNVRIKGQASDTTATFSTYADFAARAETTAYVDWSNIPVFINNTQFSSPTISSVVQETVNRAGWSSGNSMVIFLDDNGSTAGVIRDYKDYGEDATKPASLTITYLNPATNIWSTPITPNRDVGSILADGTVLTSKKSDTGDLTSQGDFYYDSSAGYLYLYSASNPATYYNGSIEAWYKGTAASNGNIVYIANKNYININNLNIKYGGGHGIQTSNVTNVTIENNSVSYVGGSYLTGTTRYGNGIEVWDGASNVTVQNNTVSYTFDEGLTAQYDSAITQDNIIFQDNTVDYSGRGMAHSSFGSPGAILSNIYWRRNIFTNSGLGWATPGISNGEGKGAQLNVADPMTNANFTDNIIRNTASGVDPYGQGILVIGGNWNVSRNWIENAHNSAIRAYGDPTLNLSYNIVVDPNTKPCMFFHGDGSNDNVTNIFNNICYASDSSNTNLIVFGADGFALTNHNYKNNVVLNDGTNTSALVYVSAASNPTLDYNLYYRNNAGNLVTWSNGTTYTQAQWTSYISASSQDTNSPTPVDPEFTTAGSDFSLLSTSPAIDTGISLGSAYQLGLSPASTWPSAVATLDQNSNGAGWDIGAYVYTQSTPPSVSITAPSSSTVSGRSTTVSASASATAPAAISSVQFLLDGSSLGSATSAPYSITWNTTQTANGNHTLSAQATDTYGNTTTASQAVIVGNGGGGLAPGSYSPPKPPVGGFGIAINAGATSTGTPTVILNLKGGSDTSTMAISHFSDFRDTGQEQYASTKAWNLCWKSSGVQTPSTCPAGTYAVYVKYYTPSGTTSETVSDSIVYTLDAPSLSRPAGSESVAPSSPFTMQPFTKDLRFGNVSADVKRLQIFLNQSPDTHVAQSGVGSPGKETTIFGYLTKAAVVKFQEKYASEILAPQGFKRGTGMVSTYTRAKINQSAGW